jgi:lysophospholipase L1-like esterase
MKLNRSSIVTFLLTLQLVLIFVTARRWLYVTTHRLYLEDRTDDGGQGTSWQHFAVENGYVVPQIITRNDARITFEFNLPTNSVLHFRVTPTGPAAYQIYLLRNGARRLVLKNELSHPVSGSALLAAGPEVLEIDNRGAVTWSDLRVVSVFHLLPHLGVLAFLFLATFLVGRGGGFSEALARAVLAVGSILMTLLLFELGAYLLRDKLPYSVVDSRRDLGMFRLDPRWQFSTRYKKRLRPNSNTMTQWEYGDLVQMAVIPAEASQATVNRFPVRTDSEGFRNAFTREHIAVAALGDSFTDALMLPAQQAWPAQLERTLGIPVQNYGVLQDYAIRHQPRVVVVAYFAGNDIFDAESFARFEQSRSEAPEIPGWKIKKVVARYHTLYTYTLARMALQRLWRREARTASTPHLPAPETGKAATASADSTPLTQAYFDRGMFHVPIRGHNMSFALMPAYLRTLNYSKSWLASRPGWDLTRRAYQEMKRTADQHGATLVVMFIPFKSQVYLPVLERFFSPEDLNRDFHFYFRENQSDADVKSMTQNRLAQNEMMRGLCEEAGILFLDLTPAIQHQIEQGNSVYFPDDAHWNAAGQERAARELAEFLRQHGLDHPAQ